MSPRDFNPNSQDSMFTQVLIRLDGQDKVLKEILEQAKKTNGRVNSLERERWYQRGFIAAVSLLVAGAWNYIKST